MSRFDVSMDQARAREGEKWRQYGPDVLGAWVADMDFPVAEPIRRALRERVERSDLGYPQNPRPDGLPTLFAERARERYGWEVDPHRVEVLTDVVQGLYVALLELCEPGDGVLIQTPIYPPFLHSVRETRRRAIHCPLAEGTDRYEIDLDRMRASIDRRTRMLMLCSPHNPSGRAFERSELLGLAELAIAHDLVVVSDEIHADLLLEPGARHIPFATLGPEVERRTLTLMSASKAFNIAGLRLALAAFGSADLKRRFTRLPRHARGGANTFGMVATEVAWRECQDWLEEAIPVLRARRDRVAAHARERWKGIAHFPPEATYLAWLDCRSLALPGGPFRFFLERARVALSDGMTFGPEGGGFVRLNFATSQPILDEILERMTKALDER
jgi:cystathionine beta-lyase